MLILLSAWKRLLSLENLTLSIHGHFWQLCIFFPVVSVTSWLAKGTLCWHYLGQKNSWSFNWQGYFPISSLDYWDMQLTLCSFFVSAKRQEHFVEREKCALFTFCLFYIWGVLEGGCFTSLHSFNKEAVRFYLTEHY